MDEALRVLLVDDDARVLAALQRVVSQVFTADTAQGPAEGLRLVDSGEPYAVVVADYQMPMMNGVEFLRKVQQASPDTVRMVLTGQGDLDVAMDAVNSGNVFRFLTKPCPAGVLVQAVQAAVRQYELVTAERDLLNKTFSASVKVLVDVLALASPLAFGRTSRVYRLVQRFAPPLVGPDGAWQVSIAAMLSQLGCITLPHDLLERAYRDELTDPEERDLFLSHPAVGRDLIGSIPRLSGVAEVIEYQEKWFDGGGPPATQRAGEGIPLGGRVLHAALGFDSLISAGLQPAAALARMQGQLRRYDPTVVSALRRALGVEERLEGRRVALADLEPNMILAEEVWARNGTLLVTKGQEISPVVIAYLRSFATRGRTVAPLRVLVPTPAPTEAALDT